MRTIIQRPSRIPFVAVCLPRPCLERLPRRHTTARRGGCRQRRPLFMQCLASIVPPPRFQTMAHPDPTATGTLRLWGQRLGALPPPAVSIQERVRISRPRAYAWRRRASSMCSPTGAPPRWHGSLQQTRGSLSRRRHRRSHSRSLEDSLVEERTCTQLCCGATVGSTVCM